MTVKTYVDNKDGTIISKLTPWCYIINQKIIHKSQVVEKKSNLKYHAILLVETFWFITHLAKLFQDKRFLQNGCQEWYFKNTVLREI